MSRWVLLYPPIIFLLGWFGGPFLSLYSSFILFSVLLSATWYLRSSLPPTVSELNVVVVMLSILAASASSLRWTFSLLRRRAEIDRLSLQARLTDLTHSVLFSEDLQMAMDLVILGMDHFGKPPGRAVFIYEPSAGELRPVSVFGLPASFSDRAVLSIIRDETGQRLADGKSIVCVDTRQPGAERVFESDGSARSCVMVPLCWLKVFVGALYLSWQRPDPLDQTVLEQLQGFCDSLAFAVHRIQSSEELGRQALTDGMTGLYNYRHLQARFREESSRALRDSTPLSFLMLDLDHFKRVNDERGPPMGDEVLRTTARALRECVRAGDVAARYSGDEFAVLCPGLSLREAIGAADRIRRATMEAIHRATGLQVTLSVGVAAYPETSSSPDAMLDHADQALYKAKSSGCNRMCVAESRQDKAALPYSDQTPDTDEMTQMATRA